ncbi:hypothetical protein QBC36DRAFT_99220 [Triangularia setosa]|uniref:Uncharacterized protein n=1 Tax=Triangularia setosa TaxID=2587417 RepID=A0AAN7A2U2_9PEZI|nr:hypothetical protein QBC36DRAFT_99220 [Podospora setosa]
MRPHRSGLSIRPPTSRYRAAYVADGSEDESLCYSENEVDYHNDPYRPTFSERNPAPYGPGLPDTPLHSPNSEYTTSTRPPSLPRPLSSSGRPLSNPRPVNFHQDCMNGFQPKYQPGYGPQPLLPSQNPHGRPRTPYRPPPQHPVASMWGAWNPPPTYLPPPNVTLNDPRRAGHHAWMPFPEPDPIRTSRPYRNSSLGPTLRSRSSMRNHNSSEARVAQQPDPAIVAALKGKVNENKVLRDELKRFKKKELKREAKEKEAKFQELKGLEEELTRYKLYEQRNQMKKEIKNEIFAEFQQGITTSPTPLAEQLGPSSGFSSEATPSSGFWTTQGGLTVGRQVPRAAGGVPLGDFLYDRYGNPTLEIYARPLNIQDVGMRGRQPIQNIRHG